MMRSALNILLIVTATQARHYTFHIHSVPLATSSPVLSIRGGDISRAKTITSNVATPSKLHRNAKVNASTDVSLSVNGGSQEELMSPVTAISNVLADLCPHGMLPLAYGIAAGGGTGPVLATAILLVFGFLSWYSLVSFARAADVTMGEGENEGESISAVWSKTLSNGQKTAWIPDVGCAFLTIGCCLFYSAFVGDLFGALSQGLLPNSVPDIFKKRSVVLLILHAVPILPLCLLRDLSALKYSSMIGLAGIVYSTFFVGKRMVDGTYAAGGEFHATMPAYLQPAAQLNFPAKVVESEGVVARVGNYLLDIPPFFAGKGILTLMNMCCVAFACHYNSVKYYLELEDRTVPKFGGVMGIGIGGTGLVFLAMMILGYGTFGANSQALLLNNYNKTDAMANLARFFTGVAILSGYPLMFAGLKSAVFSLLKIDGKNVENRDSKQNRLSVLMLSIIAIGACFVTEHELATVIGIVGSIFGSVVIYMFPAFVSNSLLNKNEDVKPFFKGEKIFNNFLVVFGVIFAILGTWVSLTENGGSVHH